MYSPPSLYLDLTAISSDISLYRCSQYERSVCHMPVAVILDVLLQLPSFISQLPDLLQQDLDLSCKGFTEIIDVPG